MSSQTFTIGELAREFDLTTRAIRFYEDMGLLAPERAGQQRVYTARDRTRLTPHAARQAPGPEADRGQGNPRHVRQPARHRGRSCSASSACSGSHRAQLEAQLAELQANLAEVRAQEKQARAALARAAKPKAR